MPLDLPTFQAYGLVVACDDGHMVDQTFRSGTKHRMVGSGQLRGHAISAGPYGPATRKLKIVGGADTIYLPFRNDEISSVQVPRTGPTLFVTDSMSGCCLYIGEKADGSLVAFHANSTKKSSMSDMAGKAVNFQHQDALRHLDALMRGAKSEAGVTKIRGGCAKTQYNKGAADATGSGQFLGGTTIVGFRNGTQWSFWFQTWGSINGGAVAMIECKEFWKG